LLLLAGCRAEKQDRQAAAQRPNILIITVDTTRADRIGCYGFPLARTPNIDRLAAEGVRCKDAVTAAPITLPSHTTILTGLFPPAHGVRDNGAYALGEDVTTLAERLKRVGYETQAFVSALVLSRRYNLTQGFDAYDDDLWSEDTPPMFMIRDRPAPRTAANTVAWLNTWEKEAQRRPFFIWTHFFDPHQPYDARIPNRWLLPSDYDAEIAQADGGVGTILDWLRDRSLLDDTFVVLVADHGESLDEHRERTHAIFIYDATVHVPMIFRHPRLLPTGTTYQGPVRTVDIVPTILGALDLPGEDETQGTDLLAAFNGKTPPPELPQYSESLLSEVGFGMAPLYGVRTKGYKWIRAPKPEVYDLKADPKELRNLYADKGDIGHELDAVLEDILVDCERFAKEAKDSPMDAETTEMLRALGYLGTQGERAAMEGIDPKDGIILHNKLEDARHLARQDRWTESEKLLRELLDVTPKNVSAWNMLGLSLFRQNRYKEAEQAYGESLTVDPRQHRVYAILANLNIKLDELDRAETLYRKSLELTPGFVEAMVGLGFIAKLRGDVKSAEQWYVKAIEADPSYPHAHRRYADLYFVREDYNEALKYYKKTLEALPNHFESLIQAGLCLKRSGRFDGAFTYFEKAAALRPDAWVVHYNMACLAAISGDPAAALVYLDKAADKGLRQPRLLMLDEDLVSVRELPGFDAVLEQVRLAAERARKH
jgi:arylsulfatase A-like enzyme/Flp pilus assembly protein TadD